MYISELKLWNFRKYGDLGELDLDNPHFKVDFQKGMNILIGENDSGKTAIIDAIKLILKTHAYEWIRITEDDFYTELDADGTIKPTEKIRIEIIFSGLTDEEASNFIEWCGWGEETIIDQEGEEVTETRPVLNLIYEVELREGRIIPSDVRAGMDGHGHLMTREARELLKATYLKPLRDADTELTSKKNSRLSQILREHNIFKKTDGEKTEFEEIFGDATKKISEEFNKKEDEYYKQIKKIIDNYLRDFINSEFESEISLGNPNIVTILEKLSLGILGQQNLGLGTMNRLFMATELLHLKRQDHYGLRLALIEELEAHLHPQAQLKIIERLKETKDVQFILTTHSPNITSKADLTDIIICKGNKAYSLDEQSTQLEPKNYKFLKRFLDVTKSNLFFSKGNIIVEGWSEEILLPVLAKKIGYDLTKNEISIINVGSTAYLHFAKIFLRKNQERMGVPISVVTDLDIRPDDNGEFNDDEEKEKGRSLDDNFKEFKGTEVELYLAKQWTLEWCLYKSCLTEIFQKALKSAHSEIFKTFNEKEFIKRLAKRDGTSLDKVRIANEFALLLDDKKDVSKDEIEKDQYLNYLVKAIKHVCDYGN